MSKHHRFVNMSYYHFVRKQIELIFTSKQGNFDIKKTIKLFYHKLAHAVRVILTSMYVYNMSLSKN